MRAEFLPAPQAEVGQDPHCIVRCTGTPDVLWQQNHCGIYRSTDNGCHWTFVSQPGGPAHFGFAIASDPADPLTAWVVPAQSDGKRLAYEQRLIVCRTHDGGQSWQELTTGLPQQNAYDIVYRHALDQHENKLAFGSTTGNAYVSLDRGDSWTVIGQNLPPVYSLRWI